MATRWKFRAARTTRSNVVTDWLGQNKQLRARIDSFLRRLRELPLPWPLTYYGPLGDGIGELRVDMGNVEHRLYGFFGPGDFTILAASSDKKRQQELIQQTKKLYRRIQGNPIETEEYIV